MTSLRRRKIVKNLDSGSFGGERASLTYFPNVTTCQEGDARI